MQPAYRDALHDWQLFFAILAGWVNNRQQAMIESGAISRGPNVLEEPKADGGLQ